MDLKWTLVFVCIMINLRKQIVEIMETKSDAILLWEARNGKGNCTGGEWLFGFYFGEFLISPIVGLIFMLMALNTPEHSKTLTMWTKILTWVFVVGVAVSLVVLILLFIR